mmetsp:Transcript_25735/g.60626  ORF Transcript_25735/g.60626 Transcript_25735/m.60626 type:complete len:621 (-) Transcript_25735:637-2499(-)
MTCSRLLSTVSRNERRRPVKLITAALVSKERTVVRGIGTRTLPPTARSSSSASSSTRVLMTPLILHQGQHHHSAYLIHHQPQHQKSQQQQNSASVAAHVVEYSTQQQTMNAGPCASQNSSSKTTTIATQLTNISGRHAHTHTAAQGLVGKSAKPPASGWKKPIVSSSSLALSSVVESSSLSSTTTEDRKPLSGAAPESAFQSIPQTVGVDMEELLKLASKKTTPLSLKDMYKYAIVDADNREQRIRNAQFLHAELPVRVAQRAVDLLTLPHGLNEIPAVLRVAHVYLLYLEKFQNSPVPTDVESENSFTDMLQGMVLERSSIPNAVAQGVDAWMQDEKWTIPREDDEVENERLRSLKEMEDALYRFFTARVGLRFLTEHHILSSPTRAASLSRGDGNNSFLGCIEPNCCPTREVRKVVEAVRKQTMEYYGDGVCPEIQIVDGDMAAYRKKANNFTYVPHHLHYMVGELLKNACRATVKRHIESGSKEKIPPIKIVIVKGVEDVTIKIADRGGGIPRSKMSEIWKFAHSTSAQDEIENETDFGVDEITGAAIRGFGLPLARIYARYLGGELTLKSLEGYGLDAYLHLPRLGNQCENLPLNVRFSPSNLTSIPLRSSIPKTE